MECSLVSVDHGDIIAIGAELSAARMVAEGGAYGSIAEGLAAELDVVVVCHRNRRESISRDSGPETKAMCERRRNRVQGRREGEVWSEESVDQRKRAGMQFINDD